MGSPPLNSEEFDTCVSIVCSCTFYIYSCITWDNFVFQQKLLVFFFLCNRYFLQPRDNGNKSLKPDDLGSLRLNVVYTEDHVFSSDYYSPLRDLLLKSADVEVIFFHCLLFTCRSSSQGCLTVILLVVPLLCAYHRLLLLPF